MATMSVSTEVPCTRNVRKKLDTMMAGNFCPLREVRHGPAAVFCVSLLADFVANSCNMLFGQVPLSEIFDWPCFRNQCGPN